MVEVDQTRKAVNLTYDTEKVKGPHINVRAENADDVGIRTGLTNDGFFVLFYGKDYHGTDHVTVEGSEEGTDEGDIEV